MKNIPLSADFPVRRHIAQNGIDPRPITAEFEQEFIPLFESSVADGMAIDLADLGFDLINGNS